MARKGNIVVDIKKENPLLTIIKAGKIPVVRLATTGFQNFKQEHYFKHYNGGAYENKNFTGRGCFVSVLGVQGSYVCGGHWGEKIHIGYLEPDDIVFGTHSFYDNKHYYCYQTAKERFESAKNGYEKYQKGVEKKNWDPDDFDLYSEAIVDSKKIRKVMVIEPEEYQLMLPYCNDGMFKIFNANNIFYHMVWDQTLSDEFVTHMHWVLKDGHHFFYKETEIYSLLESSFYKSILMEELVHYYTNGTFIRTSDFYEKLQDAMLDYVQKAKNFYPSYDEDAVFRSLRKDCIYLHYEENSWRDNYSVSAFSNLNEVTLSIAKSKYSYPKEYDNYKFTEENILSKKHRGCLYHLVELKNIFNECMGEFIKIDFPKWMHILETFKNLEDAIGKWNISYTYDEKNHEILFDNGDFKFLYNLILLDGVVEVKEDDETQYYNLDKLPDNFNRFWLDIILETLTIWEYY